MNNKIIQSTREFWQKKTSSTITDERARTIFENLSGFFEVLSRWEETQKMERYLRFLKNIPWIPIGILNTQISVPKREEVLIALNGYEIG